jgi:homoserine O-acetyltransferase/O-succinyltransferase
MISLRAAALFVFVTCSFAAGAADYPAPKEGVWVARDFKFHTGEVLPEVRLHYRTIGKPDGIPIVVLHGTGSSGQSMLTPAFADRSMPKNTTSSFPTRSATGNRQSRPTD